MKILIIFLIALFMMAACQKKLKELRYKKGLTTNQIYNTLILPNNMTFFRAINGDFNEAILYVCIVSAQSSLIKKFHKVKEQLDKLTNIFLLRSFGYIVKNLNYHLSYIDIKLKDRSNGPLTAEEDELIRFPKNQELCIFTYMYDYGKFDVEHVLEAMYYLKTFTESDIPLLKIELSRLQSSLEAEKILEEIGKWDDGMNDEIWLKKEFTERWRYIKDQIYLGSKIFCDTAGPPLIGEDIFDTEEIKSNMFMQYVFVAEICKVTFIEGNDSGLPKFIAHNAPSVTHLIDTWDCSNILLKSFENTTVKPELKWRNKAIDRSNYFYSLESLHKTLENNRYFLNVMQYDNIVADVLLYVAIKEGNRMMIVMDGIIRSQCTPNSPTDIYNSILDHAWLFLTLFKHHFHDFINTVLKKRRIDLRIDNNFKAFKKTLDTVLVLMNILIDPDRDVNIMTKNCPYVTDTIAQVLTSVPSLPSGNLNPFNTVNMNRSVLNIRRLTQYVNNIGTKY